MRKNGMSQHDNDIVKSVYERMLLDDLNESNAIELVSSISNVDADYIKSLVRSYRRQK